MLQNASFDWTKLFYGLQVQTLNRKKSWILGKTINWTVIPSEYPACQDIDIKNHINLLNNTPEILIFSFMKINMAKIGNYDPDVQVSFWKKIYILSRIVPIL